MYEKIQNSWYRVSHGWRHNGVGIGVAPTWKFLKKFHEEALAKAQVINVDVSDGNFSCFTNSHSLQIFDHVKKKRTQLKNLSMFHRLW